MTGTREIAEQLQSNLKALYDTTQSATPLLFQDVVISPPPDPNNEKILSFEKEMAYVTFGGGNNFEEEYSHTHDTYDIPALITVYLPGLKEVEHPRGMDIADLIIDMIDNDNNLQGKVGAVYINEFIQGSLDLESIYVEILQFMLVIQKS